MKNNLRTKQILNNEIYKDGIIVMILYAVLFLLITYFHEPWFDEAQAWEIGRTATYKEMFTVLPHTEGHPPLWSLILSIPAKLGMPYYIGLKSASFVFSAITVYLIVIKSPFPKLIRYMLPFTYFIFYQYGVISRTYCVLELACILIALTFEKRNEKPWRFIGCLYLLCLTSTYGILIACGICVCWLWDISHETDNKVGLIVDKRIKLLFVLLIVVLPVIYIISPSEDAYALKQLAAEGTIIKRLFYFLFVMPGDAFVSFGPLPSWDSFGPADIVSGLIVTIILVFYILLISKCRDIKYFIIPYVFYALFMSVYGTGNHTGIGMIYLICYIWSVYDKGYIDIRMKKTAERICKLLKKQEDYGILPVMKAIPTVIIAMSLVYNIFVSIEDIMLPYSEAQAIAGFIKEHNMQDANIMIEWTTDKDTFNSSDDVHINDDEYQSENTFDAVAILPYFKNNIFFNHNIRDHRKGYVSHLVLSKEENKKNYELWHDFGRPEVLIGLPPLHLVYNGEVTIGDYVSVATMTGYYMGKNIPVTQIKHIYVRKDCLNKFGLSPMELNK